MLSRLSRRGSRFGRSVLGTGIAAILFLPISLSGSTFAQQSSGQDLHYPSFAAQSTYASIEDVPSETSPAEAASTDNDSLDGEWSDCNCNRCDSSSDFGLGGLCSLIQPSDHCYDDFISPMTNPVFFEDPRNLTEARVIFLNHKVPLAAGGGDVQLYALQIRAALTDRLSLIATKDGYIVSQNPVIGDGWADISAGLKYLLYSDPASQRLASAGAVYEIPIGTADSQQDNGTGTFDLFLTGGSRIFCNGHWIGAGGFVLPTDDDANST